MDSSVGVSLMLMYEDESLEVRYVNGAQLQLSPCGSEFMVVKAAETRRHPLQPPERLRQRTRFAISKYKELLVAALAFRNRYASQPYLPEELISAESKKPFFSIDSSVRWPNWALCEAELGAGGETIVRSKGGEATLTLASSGEDFSVEFMCNLSQNQNQTHRHINGSSGDLRGNQPKHAPHRGVKELTQSTTCSSKNISSQLKPELVYQSTTVVQHHSCFAVPSMWAYPLSLARHLWTADVSKADNGVEGTSKALEPEISCEVRESQLPLALPLTCHSPHLHKWKYKDPLATDEHSDIPTEFLKVMWCQGVTYRIVNGAVPVVEVSPGDGSVIRSTRVLNGYFTHYKSNLRGEKGKEVSYHVSSLPPDVLSQAYLVSSTVTRASRILACHNQAKQLLQFSVTPSCLHKELRVSKPVICEEKPSHAVPDEQDVNVKETADWRSELVAAELEKIQRFNFLLEYSQLQSSGKEPAALESIPTDVTEKPLDEKCIAEALQKTSKAIQDIDAVISAASRT